MNSKKLRTPLIEFAVAMEAKLKRNDCKGGWERDSIRSLIDRIEDELIELSNSECCRGDLSEIMDEAVDVANFAMMVFDNASSLLKVNRERRGN